MAATSRSDYIARIRYLNSLPPPPNPPKLLNIPNTGLTSGQYTSPAFASRVAREQPLNIEADAELGMPVNLIGIPGVFNGDESAIYAPDIPPPIHPHDKALLKPLSMLGKASSMAGSVSFLRRTEYIASEQRSVDSSKARDLRLKQDRKRKRPETEQENDPSRILRAVQKGFDIAYPQDASNGGANLRGAATDVEAWEQPRHPTRPDLTVLDTYPILPDLDAFPDTGFYILTKFITNPSANADEYDPRLDVGLLRPLEPSPEVIAQFEAERARAEADPTVQMPVSAPYNYEFFLPEKPNASTAIKTKFNINNSQKDDPSLYDNENKESGKRFFRYQRLRAYETYQQNGDAQDYYNDSVALALHDSEEGPQGASRLRKGAYFYPIMQRTNIRPRRQAGTGVMGLPAASQAQTEEQKVDYLEVVVRDPNEAEASQRKMHKDGALGEAVAPVAVE